MVVGSIIGFILILLALFFLWRRCRRDDTTDFDDEFTLSGPANEKVAASSSPDPNPFLIAGGYNSFNTEQQQHNYDEQSHNRQSSYGDGHDPHTYSQLAYAGLQHTSSNSGSNGHSRTTLTGFVGHGTHNLFSDKDFKFYDIEPRPPSPEMGRRKLSNGLLPDMIARQPGSLKVVNN